MFVCCVWLFCELVLLFCCFVVLLFSVEPIRPIDPSAWVQQTNQMQGVCVCVCVCVCACASPFMNPLYTWKVVIYTS